MIPPDTIAALKGYARSLCTQSPPAMVSVRADILLEILEALSPSTAGIETAVSCGELRSPAISQQQDSEAPTAPNGWPAHFDHSKLDGSQ